MTIFTQIRTLATKSGASSPDEFSFEFGTDADESPAIFRPAIDGHLCLTGGPGAGKTVLLRALAEEAVQVMEVHVADAWAALDLPSSVHPDGAASVTSTAEGCAEMLEHVLAEARRRLQQCQLEGADAFDVLENPLRRILVILDDSRHLLSNDEYSRAGDLAAKKRSVACIEEIARYARLAGVTFAFSSQWTAESWTPVKSLDDSCSRLELKSPHYRLDWLDAEARKSQPPTRVGLYTPAGRPGSMVQIKNR